jgi:hypothetical protein
MNEQADAVRLIVDRAQARLDAQLRDNDALDVKALGLLAVDAAVLGVLIATHDSLNHLWAIPAATLIAAGFFFLGAVWRREFDSGPNWREFYEEHAWEPIEDIARHMLSDLLTAIEWNDAHGRSKGLLYDIAFRAGALGLLGAGIVGLVR